MIIFLILFCQKKYIVGLKTARERCGPYAESKNNAQSFRNQQVKRFVKKTLIRLNMFFTYLMLK